jgi:hypothetical protein
MAKVVESKCPPAHWVRESVADFEKTRLPADQKQVRCPACGRGAGYDIGLGWHERNVDVEYRTKRLLRASGGDTLEAGAFGEHDPHLRVRCNCGFWWEREVVQA